MSHFLQVPWAEATHPTNYVSTHCLRLSIWDLSWIWSSEVGSGSWFFQIISSWFSLSILISDLYLPLYPPNRQGRSHIFLIRWARMTSQLDPKKEILNYSPSTNVLHQMVRSTTNGVIACSTRWGYPMLGLQYSEIPDLSCYRIKPEHNLTWFCPNLTEIGSFTRFPQIHVLAPTIWPQPKLSIFDDVSLVFFSGAADANGLLLQPYLGFSFP